MKLLKKTIASIALVTLVSSLFTTGAFAYSEAEKTAADSLAAKGIIVAKADAAGYNLDQNVLRQEIAAVARGVAEVAKKTTCAGSFKDVTATTPNDWACYSIEALLDAGLIAKNDTFRPEANITKAEAVGMMVKAAYGAEYAFNPALGTTWQEQVVAFAVEKGIIASFTNYEALATRGFVFEVGASAISGGGDDLSDLMDDLLGEDEDEDDTTSTGTTDETVVSGDNVLTVSLSADTAEGASIPAGVNGLEVATYDFTAGSEDVTVTSIILKRKGLSDADTILGLAAFSDEGRASKAKDDSQESNTEATLTLTNGFTIKAGETRALTIVADINDTETTAGRDTNATSAANDEFAIELKEVTTSSEVETSGSLIGNTFRVGSVDAAILDINNNGTVSNPKIGEESTNIFKFEVKGDSNDDVVLNSITFKSDSSDAEEDLANFTLLMGTTEVATTTSMNDKYLTFSFDEGITIGKGKTEKFTVTADIVAGAGDTIGWYVDKNLDVKAEDTKYGYGAAINIDDVNNDGAPAGDSLKSFTVQAGELTLIDIDPSSDKIREDKDDVTLGKIKVTNIAGKSLELQKFGVLVTPNYGTTGLTALTQVFENFELYSEDTGTSYELELSGNVYQDLDLNVTLPQGESNFTLRADTKDGIATFDTATFELSLNTDSTLTDGIFYAVETEDDKQVTDLTPSSLAWKKLKGSESGASLTQSPLSDLTKVRGAKGVVGLQFEVDADDSSALTIDELDVTVNSGNDMDGDGTANNVDADTDGDGTANVGDTDDDNDGTLDGTDTTPTGPAAAGLANNTQISQVTLYKGSVSEANLLDRVSGSNLASGVATFDGFKVDIAADAKQTFIVTVDFVDGVDATVNGRYNLSINSANIEAEDEDNDDVTITGGVFTSARDITVKDYGTLALTEDAQNTDNKDLKTILAGTSKNIFSIDVQATNESVDVEKVVFTVDTDLTQAVESASLYLGDTLIAKNSNSDITATTITFDSLTTLIVPQESKELKLMLNTAVMGFEKVGKSVAGVNVTQVLLTDAEGADSGKAVADASDTGIATSQNVSIVPAVITPSVQVSLNSSTTPQVKLTSSVGSNIKDTSNTKPNTLVNTISFSTLGTNITAAEVYTLTNADDSADTCVGAVVGGVLTFDLATNLDAANRTITADGSETFKITVTGTAEGDTLSLTLLENGVNYDVEASGDSNEGTNTAGATINIENELDFGTRSY